MKKTEKILAKKSAQAIVEAAVLVNEVKFGIQISYQMRKRWARLIANYPELSASLFSYGRTGQSI